MAYLGFSKLKAKIAAKGDVRDPGAVAAAIGRKKYGKAAFQKAAATGHKMKGMSHLPSGVSLTPEGDIGAHRGAEAEALGTFKSARTMDTAAHFAKGTPRTQTDAPYGRFKGAEEPTVG